MKPAAQRAFTRLAADLRRVFGDRFVALVAYGVNASVAFASRVESADLEAMGPLASAWHHDHLATPLVMTPDEFRRSLDAFPLEYQDILDHHTVIAGTPPFAGVEIHRDDLRRACEAQARGHLIHLRQGWIQNGAHDEELGEMIVRSAGPFRALLSNVARLHGQPCASSDELVAFAESTIGMPGHVVRSVLAHEENDEHEVPGGDARPLLASYLAATEQLWHFIDVWRES